MKLCPKCGGLSFFNSYFCKMMCNTCEHTWVNEEPEFKVSSLASIQIIDTKTGKVLLETTCDTQDIDINPESCSIKLNRECNIEINNSEIEDK